MMGATGGKWGQMTARQHQMPVQGAGHLALLWARLSEINPSVRGFWLQQGSRSGPLCSCSALGDPPLPSLVPSSWHSAILN